MIVNLPNFAGYLSTNKLSVELKQRTDLMESGIPQVRIPEFRYEPVSVSKITGIFSIDNNTSTVRDYYSRVIDTTLGRLSYGGNIEVDKNIDFWRAVVAGAEIGVLENGIVKYYTLHADDEFINPEETELNINGDVVSYSSKHILSNGYSYINSVSNNIYSTTTNPYWLIDTTRKIEVYSETYPELRGVFNGSLSYNNLQITAVSANSGIVTSYVYWREPGSAWYPTRLRTGRLFAPTGLPVFDMRVTFNKNTPNEVVVVCEGVMFLNAKDSFDKGNVTMSLDFVAKRVYIKSTQ